MVIRDHLGRSTKHRSNHRCSDSGCDLEPLDRRRSDQESPEQEPQDQQPDKQYGYPSPLAKPQMNDSLNCATKRSCKKQSGHGQLETAPTSNPVNIRASLRNLVWFVLLSALTPFVGAQYTEMIAWTSGSNVVNTATGPGNSYPQARSYLSSFYEPALKLFHVFGGQTPAGSRFSRDGWVISLTYHHDCTITTG